MRSKLSLLALAAALAGCQHTPNDLPDRGLSAVNVPVVATANYALDLAAPGGGLAPSEAERLDNWLQSLGVRFGDVIYVDAPYSDPARADVARIAGQYGLLVTPGTPVTAGPVAPGTVRVVVSRSEASVPGCPNWSTPAQPNYNNRTMSNYGCGVNSNLAAMVASPGDLVHGREGSAAVDAATASKAIQMYRNWPLTGITQGQGMRPLKKVEDTTAKGN